MFHNHTKRTCSTTTQHKRVRSMPAHIQMKNVFFNLHLLTPRSCVYTCDMTSSRVWRDSFTVWLIRTYLQKRHTYPQKSPIYPQKSSIILQMTWSRMWRHSFAVWLTNTHPQKEPILHNEPYFSAHKSPAFPHTKSIIFFFFDTREPYIPHKWALPFHTEERCISKCTCVSWLIYMCVMAHLHVCHGSFACVSWLIRMCVMAHSHVCHGSFTCVRWLIHICVMAHSHVCHGSFACVSWLVHMCVMAHSHVCHGSLTCVSWLIYMCVMAHLHVCHTMYEWVIYMNESSIWMSHVYEWVIYMNESSIWTSHLYERVIYMNESSGFAHMCIYEWVIAHIWMRPLSHMCHAAFSCLIHMCAMTHSYMHMCAIPPSNFSWWVL